ncbi:unnamed protein product, partial [Ectocarpus sp. 12 AP-2014]
NFKACCGLLASSKDDADHDYEDMEQDPLPKPQTAADLRRKELYGSAPSLSEPSRNVYAAAGYSAKARKSYQAVSRASSISDATRSDRTEQRNAWRAGASASNPITTAQDDEKSQQQRQPDHVPTMEPLARAGSGGGGGSRSGASGSGGGGRPRQPPLASASSAAGVRENVDARGAAAGGGGGNGGRRVRGRSSSSSGAGVEAMRPAPKGAVGMGKVGAAGAAGAAVGAGSRSQGGPSDYNSRHGSQSSSGSRPPAVAAAPAPAEPAFDLAGFEEKLGGGLIVTKINRQGRAKVRALFYDRQERMLWWNEPGRGSPHRSSLLSIKKEQPLSVASLIKVEMADQLDEPFCFDGDVDKSFQLVFPARTVDLVAKDAEEAALLARGFQVGV